MPRMIDLVRSSRLPSNLMQFAACGALSAPPGETIEILVHLALHNHLFGAQAGLTLAGWDEKASRAAAADPQTSPEVLRYFVDMENLRTCLLPALAENPSVSEEALDRLAMSGSRPIVEILLKSRRVMNSPRLLEALQSNPNLQPNELAEIEKKPAALEKSPEADAPESGAVEAEPPDEVLETTVTKYLEENAAELAAEKDKPFEPIGMAHEEIAHQGAGGEAAGAVEPQAAAATAGTSADAAKIAAEKSAMAAAGKTAAALAALHATKHPHPGHERTARQHAAEDCQTRHQGTDLAGHARQQGGAVDSGSRRHQTCCAGGTGVAQSFRWRGGRLCAAEKCAGGGAARDSD